MYRDRGMHLEQHRRDGALPRERRMFFSGAPRWAVRKPARWEFFYAKMDMGKNGNPWTNIKCRRRAPGAPI